MYIDCVVSTTGNFTIGFVVYNLTCILLGCTLLIVMQLNLCNSRSNYHHMYDPNVLTPIHIIFHKFIKVFIWAFYWHKDRVLVIHSSIQNRFLGVVGCDTFFDLMGFG